MTDIQSAALKRYMILLDSGVEESVIDIHIFLVYGSDILQYVKDWLKGYQNDGQEKTKNLKTCRKGGE